MGSQLAPGKHLEGQVQQFHELTETIMQEYNTEVSDSCQLIHAWQVSNSMTTTGCTNRRIPAGHRRQGQRVRRLDGQFQICGDKNGHDA